MTTFQINLYKLNHMLPPTSKYVLILNGWFIGWGRVTGEGLLVILLGRIDLCAVPHLFPSLSPSLGFDARNFLSLEPLLRSLKLNFVFRALLLQ